MKPRKFLIRSRRRSERFARKHHAAQAAVSRSLERQDFTSLLAEAVGSKRDSGVQVTLHLGSANSGKTYDAIETLKKAATGCYLAPLRLLAWEISDKLNSQKHPCSLLTGEEKVLIPGAPYTSSTVEMFNPEAGGDCIVLDEAQMLADTQRGWAWMRVLALARAKRLEIIASPDAEALIAKILNKLGYQFTVVRHERLAPLTIARKPWRIDHPELHTIFVVFSRAGVLNLKSYFERHGHSVAAIYGNLPPEVKKKQAERFLSGEAELCVATDSIGMGMNLPASKVCFTTLVKFDGIAERLLTPAEARQIAGRAGRYGIKEAGEVGALEEYQLKQLHELLSVKPPDLEYARVGPEIADIANMSGPLALRLELWEKHKAVPPELRDVIRPMDLEQQRTLAGFLKEEDVKRLGLETVFAVIKAPASRDTVAYWWSCVQSLIVDKPFPLPSGIALPDGRNDDALLNTEILVEQCDIYLWLANRRELGRFGTEVERVLEHKWSLIEKIDRTLTAKSNLQQRCRKCGGNLPVLHKHSICESCFRSGRGGYSGRSRHRRGR